uniref:RNA polymerase subunit sigma-70 n=1 Tax=Nonomuraea bangladeshensis TaxID=404385 RepID=UPI003F495186
MALANSLRGELTAHCYRLLGSMHDAEDQVQETLLRAWRSYGDFEGRSSLRTWLYRIATNVCLTALDTRRRRPLPSGLPHSWDGDTAPGTWGMEDNALVSGALADPAEADPATIVSSREDRTHALQMLWKHLSPRQRAVLIMRDVLNWQANEIAEALGTSGTAVHSMLRRARAQLNQLPEPVAGEMNPVWRRMLDRYAAAFETGDVAVLASLLAEDAMLDVGPTGPRVLTGRELVARQLELCSTLGNCRMVPITITGKPGFAVYRPDAGAGGVLRAYALEVLDVSDAGIEGITVAEDRGVFVLYGLPMTIGADAQAADDR